MGTPEPSVVIACGDAARVATLARAVEAAGCISAKVPWPITSVIDAGAVLLVDADMGSSDLRGLRDLTQADAALRVLVLGPVRSPVHVMVVLACGPLGYVPRDSASPAVTHAVASVVAGDNVVPGVVSRRLVEHLRNGGRITVPRADARATQLSHRQWDVFVLVCQGRTAKEIATI